MTTATRVQYRDTPLTNVSLKATSSGWSVSGYASTYNVDAGGDRVVRGAFADSLRAWQAGQHPIRFLHAHHSDQVLGVPTELYEDRKGLYGEFRISKTRLGEDVHTLLQDSALDSFSIGYLVDEAEFD